MIKNDVKAIWTAVLLVNLAVFPAAAAPILPDFDSKGPGRIAISALLNTYTNAVSTKNVAMFEALLLSKDIPFSGVGDQERLGESTVVTRNYGSFRQNVPPGAPFTQNFENVHVEENKRLPL